MLNTIRRIGTAVLICALSRAPDASGAPSGPVYDNLRFNDTLSACCTGACTDVWAPVKCIPLSEAAPPTCLSLGGQARVRWENWENFNFAEANDDDFLLTRLRLHSDLYVNEVARIFVEARSALSSDRDLPGGERPTDADTFDLLNAFLDLQHSAGPADLTLRGGIQELSYGKQRLVSPLDWANTRRSFSGGKLMASSGPWQADALWARLVNIQKTDFNDGDSGKDLFGGYATRKIAPMGGGADIYWLALDEDIPVLEATTVQDERRTVGARLFGACPITGVEFDIEGAGQYGEREDHDVRAWMAGLEFGYKLPGCPVRSRLAAGFDYASGDDDPHDDTVGTFNQLFPLGHAYLGYIDAVGRQNILDSNLSWQAKPCAKVKTRVDAHWFQRAENTDALYNASGAIIRAGNAGYSHDVGQELDALVTYDWDIHTQLAAGYSHFFPGDFIKESGESEDTDFVYASAQYTF